jgi:dGTPase
LNADLAPYAVDMRQSRGRRVAESPPAWRSEFQRDRDRVIHSSAFRRLEYKTQVFVNHEGDMFRTRLTHSLEVAQVARTIARALGVNEDLTEAIALAHDLGHTPFGHAGQAALNHCMQPYGGFEHNLHSLRVVDELEQRYAAFDGLNLLFETREGILKHCSVLRAAALGELGARFLLRRQPSLEAQIANVADEIAYNHHDIDDGLRSGILALETVCEHDGFREAVAMSRANAPGLGGKRLTYTAIRHMLGAFVADLIDATRERLARHAPHSVEDVRAHPQAMVDFSPDMREAHLRLKRLLYRRLYYDPSVQRIAEQAKTLVAELFEAFMRDPGLLPAGTMPAGADEALRARVVSDYIAGMTDRYAQAEHGRVFGGAQAASARPWPRT